MIYFFSFFLLFFLSPIDTDLGWYLRYGEHFINTGQIVSQNNLTYYLENYYWANPYTLYEIIVTILFRIAGFWGLTFFYALFATGIFYLFSRINKDLPKTGYLAAILITLTGWNVFSLGIRSQVFTFAGLVFIFWILTKTEKNLKIIFILPLVFFLWANIHGGFVLGLMVLLLAAISFAVVGRWRQSFFIGIATIISFLTSLINPYGFGVYQWAFKHMQVPLSGLIAEWVMPPFWMQIVIFVGSILLLAMLFASKLKKRIFWILILIPFALLSLLARRNLPFFTLVSALIILDIFYQELAFWEKQKIFQNIFFPVCLLGFFSFSIIKIPHSLELITNWDAYCYQGLTKYPCKAVEFIKQTPLKGINVYNVYEWGGFLEWQLPQYKYFVDGRMPAWPTPQGKSPYTVYLAIIQAKEGYQKTLDQYKTDWLLIGSGTFLDLELGKNKNTPWKEIYRDEVAAIYVRSDL